MTETNSNIIKNIVELNKDIPTIQFMRHPTMAGMIFSNATPCELGGCGIPIPEHKELYEKCKKEDTKFYWTIFNENIPTIKFIRHPSMTGPKWSEATPPEYGGCGIPIPEHKELYEKCKKEGTRFYWTSDFFRV